VRLNNLKIFSTEPYKMFNDKLLLDSLYKYYEKDYAKRKLISVLKNDKNISLRSIDWFITNYSKKNNIFYLIYENKDGEPTFEEKNNIYTTNLNVYHSYKAQLKAYSKKRFDPFCRRDRVSYEYGENDTDILETTIGQLNFFKWAINNLVIDYIMNHKKEIEDDMNLCLKASKKNSKKNGTRKRRQELSLSATRGLNLSKVPIQLEFN